LYESEDENINIKEAIHEELNSMQNTLTSMRTEIKIQNKVSINEEFDKISMPSFITSFIRDNLRLAKNGCN